MNVLLSASHLALRVFFMFIQTEETPNPLVLKFVPGKPVLAAEGTITFSNKESAWRAPLAESLFSIIGVDEIFFTPNFISVTKTSEYDWVLLKPQILGHIMEYFMENESVEIRSEPAGQGTPPSENIVLEADLDADTLEIISEIKELIDSRIRPAVAQDGGDITFERFADGIVYLKMHGACSGCPSSSVTLKNGVENMLRHYVPEVKEVLAV